MTQRQEPVGGFVLVDMRGLTLSMKFRFVDLFCGIGGIRLGFEKACQRLSIESECVFSSDISKSACVVYRSKFRDSHNPLVDITEVSSESIPDFEVLLAGTPCQAFSHAGKKMGFEDTRGTLFFDVARIVQNKKPKVILIENVKGLLSHNKGKTLCRIIEILRGMGYIVNYSVLNSVNYGVPQNRERIYIVAFLGMGEKFVFPELTDSSKRLIDILDENPVDAKYYLSERYYETLKRHRAKHEKKGQGFGYIVRTEKDIAGTIMCGGMGKERNIIRDQRTTDFSERKTKVNEEYLRFMTPLEWERLQGFPDGWTNSVGDSSRMNLLGNSVTVPVIEQVSIMILKELLAPTGSGQDLFY